MLRANIVKSQIADIESMKFKLESKDDDVRELRKQLKMKVGLFYFTDFFAWEWWGSIAVEIRHFTWHLIPVPLASQHSRSEYRVPGLACKKAVIGLVMVACHFCLLLELLPLATHTNSDKNDSSFINQNNVSSLKRIRQMTLSYRTT